MAKIKNSPLISIEDKYGEMVFRTALCHLISAGAQAIQDKDEIEGAIVQINENTSKGAFFTAEYQIEILNCAVEISEFSPLDILKYVKCNVYCG